MGIIAKLMRQGLEDPRVPLRALDADLGLRTRSGQKVSRESALTYAAVWRAVNLISRDFAKIPLEVLERTEGGKERASNHPAYRLLRWKANEHTSSFVFRETLIVNALLTGNGYAIIERDNAGRPIALLQVDPRMITPVRKEGLLWYVLDIGTTGQTVRIQPDDMIHIKGISFDGLVGISVLQRAAESMAMGIAARDFGAVYFRNAATPKIALEHPMNLTKQAADRLRDSWERMHTGIDNAHRPAILEEAMRARVLSFNHKDSQLLELREFELKEVASWFGVPVHKLGSSERSSFASLEAENQSYLDEALDPWFVKSEMEYREKLLTENQKRQDTHVVEHKRAALVRVDAKGRASLYQSGIMNGWLNRDEVRNAENLPPIPEGAGETFFVPLNIAPIEAVVSSDHDDDEEDKEDMERQVKEKQEQVSREVLSDAVKRAGRRLAASAMKAAKKPEAFLDFLDRLEKEHEEAVRAFVATPLRAARIIGVSSTEDPAWLSARMIETVRADLLKIAGECNVGKLPQGVTTWAEQLQDSLDDQVKQWVGQAQEDK